MTWFKVSDNLWGHPKFTRLSGEATKLWLRSGSWSCQYLTDGFVPDDYLAILGGTLECTTELVSAGLWERLETGFVFHDWSHIQSTKSEVESLRERDRDRKRAAKASSKPKKSGTSVRKDSTRQPAKGIRADSTRNPDGFPERRGEERSGEERSVRKQVVPSDRGTPDDRLAYLVDMGLAEADDAEREAIANERTYDLSAGGDA